MRGTNKNLFSAIIIVFMIILLIFVYSKYDYNYYSKAVSTFGKTSFTRDSEEKYNGKKSYKIENKDYTNSMFYRKISVSKNTVYKVSCMVKTEDILVDEKDNVAGAQILLKNTEEHSKVLKGTNEWTKLEFCFNSKDCEEVEIGFVLGGVNTNAKGKAWFSNFEIEQGYQSSNNEWNFICFVFNKMQFELDNGKKIEESISSIELSALNKSYTLFETTLNSLSKNKIKPNCTLVEINEPLTTLSYDKENGYYIGEKDVYDIINPYLEGKEYDHIFVCTKMPDQEKFGNDSATNWIGLGSMEFCGKGFSNIRILDDGVNFEYSIYTDFPQEVFLHEFLHTLERNAIEYGYTIPALHDNEKYGYKDTKENRLKNWYIDYMSKLIKNENGEYIGLPNEIFEFTPAQLSDFNYSIKLDLLDEPKNIIEIIRCMSIQVGNLFTRVKDTQKEIQIVSD